MTARCREYVAKTKTLLSRVITALLICAFVFACSHNAGFFLKRCSHNPKVSSFGKAKMKENDPYEPLVQS